MGPGRKKRSGPVPAWAKGRLDAMPVIELEDIALRLLDAESIEGLLK